MNARDYFKSLPTLRTDRLILRKLSKDDAPDMFAYASDPRMTNFTTWSPHKSIDDSRAFLAECEHKSANGQAVNFAIIEASSNKFIGTCGLSTYVEQHERGELGYAIAHSHWGQGLMTEAARAAIDSAFRSIPMTRLQCCCHVDNVASYRIMEKLGMKFEGVLRSYFKIGDRYHDLRFYSLLRSDWKNS